ncbi:MAG: tetratricopeptide repeat protein, partial [Verrucomicrobia bacterium]|nr:tetratricopeptide repeat protein [Verrucomicrobiota bacterium]
KWYRKAADQGNAIAQFNLGGCYYGGEGVPKDYIEAVKWYRKAADQGDADAQFNLGVCCSEGRGVEQNFVEAYKWFSFASAEGIENAKAAKLAVAQQMTPEQIAKGDRLAREFKPISALESGGPVPSR